MKFKKQIKAIQRSFKDHPTYDMGTFQLPIEIDYKTLGISKRIAMSQCHIPFTGRTADLALADADQRGLPGIRYLYSNGRRGAPGTFRLIFEFPGKHGYLVLHSPWEYFQLLAVFNQEDPVASLLRQVQPEDTRLHLANYERPRERRFRIYYEQLSPDDSMNAYVFYTQHIQYCEARLRRQGILADDEKLPSKKTIYEWIKLWELRRKGLVEDDRRDVGFKPTGRTA